MMEWGVRAPLMALSCVAMNAFILYKTDKWMTPKRDEDGNKDSDQQSSSRIIYRAAHAVNLFSLVIFSQMPSSMLLYILYSCGMSLTEVYVLHRVPMVKRLLMSTIPSQSADTKMTIHMQQ